MRQPLNQKGFSLVECLLVIIALALIVFVGYYVYHTQKATDKTLNSASKVSQSSPEKGSIKKVPASGQKLFTIKEWNVGAPYTGSLSLEYNYHYSSTEQYASFSSAQLDASDPQCASEDNYGGLVVRYASTDIVPNEDGSSSGQTPQQYLAAGGYGGLNGGNYAHIGNYYYIWIRPQGICGSSQGSQDIQSQTEDAVKGLVQQFRSVSQ